MIHFKNIKPTSEQMQDPKNFYRRVLPSLISKEARDLSDRSSFDMKLIDFGFAKTFDESTAQEAGLSTTTKGIGAGIVQAPEMVNAELDLYDERVDVWYIGCLALILFSNDIHKVAKTKEYWFIKATPEK